MIKKIIAVILVATISLFTLGCATDNDVKMYEDYTEVIDSVSDNMLNYFSQQLTVLAQSIPVATTPLERHLIRESIVELTLNIQSVQRATGTNEVLDSLATRSTQLLSTVGSTIGVYKGLEVAGEVLGEVGGVSASEGSTINFEKTEEHTTAIGEGASSTSKADPIVVEVPTESAEE